MLASAVRTYVNRFAVAPGRRVAVFTNNDDGWRTARDLAARRRRGRGRHRQPPATCRRAARAALPARARHCGRRGDRDRRRHARCARSRCARGAATETHRGRRAGGVGRLESRPCTSPAISAAGRPGTRRIAAFVPGSAAARHDGRRRRQRHDDARRAASPTAPRPARAAAEATGLHGRAARRSAEADDEPFAIAPLWHVAGSTQKAFVDFQNDVTADDIALAEREGFRSVEHLKRYTTLGMATDQGKTSNVTGLAHHGGADRPLDPGDRHHHASARPIRRSRSARSPATIAARISARPAARRRTPGREQQGAVFVETGPWLRAQYFPRAGETRLARRPSAARCARCARRVGFCDVSTLGKIDVQGPDAGAFLDRLYINTFSTLPVGRARYGVMLREDGFVLDDGTTSRLADDRFFMTTTTANAGARLPAHAVLPSGAVAGARRAVRLGRPTSGRSSRSPARARATRWPRSSIRRSISATPPFPIMAAAELTVCGGVPARLYPHLVLGRARLRDRRAGALRRCARARA